MIRGDRYRSAEKTVEVDKKQAYQLWWSLAGCSVGSVFDLELKPLEQALGLSENFSLQIAETPKDARQERFTGGKSVGGKVVFCRFTVVVFPALCGCWILRYMWFYVGGGSVTVFWL